MRVQYSCGIGMSIESSMFDCCRGVGLNGPLNVKGDGYLSCPNIALPQRAQLAKDSSDKSLALLLIP
jgi:hypothetical protein